jgi:hypothetical protein
MEDKRMSEQNPYTKLEVPEDASFEEIQSARDRLIERYPTMNVRAKTLKWPTMPF